MDHHAVGQTAAERCWIAYLLGLSRLAQDDEELRARIERLPTWPGPDKGAAWFAVAADVESLTEPPEALDPYEHELTVPIEPRRLRDLRGDVVLSHHHREDRAEVAKELEASADDTIRENLPTALTIRPMEVQDLCVRAGPEGFDVAVYAEIHGVEPDMLADRVDPSDAIAGRYLVHDAAGRDAWSLLHQRFVDAGGVDISDGDKSVWDLVAMALLATDQERSFLLRTRTPEIGTVQIGPLNMRAIQAHENIAATEGEWAGRIAALAIATKRSVDQIKTMRIEDADRAWGCFAKLKKKANDTARSIFALRLSSLSTVGDPQTSQT